MNEFATRVSLKEYEITFRTDSNDNYRAVKELCQRFVHEEESYVCPNCFYHIRNRDFEYCPNCGREVKWDE